MARSNSEACAADYAKHREKRLAAKRAKYQADREAHRERNRRQYAKHQQKRVEYAREYRRKNRERLAAEARKKYAANAAEINARRAIQRKEPEARQKQYAHMRDWLSRNPDKAQRMHAKRLINEQTGIPIRDIPNDVADAKVEQLKIGRWAREQGEANARG